MKALAVRPNGMAVIDLERADGRAVAVQLEPPVVYPPINPQSIWARGGSWEPWPAQRDAEPYFELVRQSGMTTADPSAEPFTSGG